MTFQPEDPNFLRNVVIAWCLFFALFYILFITSGCSTTEKPVVVILECPATKLTGNIPLDQVVLARDGCLRYYGPGACLISLTEVGPLTYHAICRRKPK